MSLAELPSKGKLRWNAIPFTGVAFGIHKFSILDEVERASNLLESDYGDDYERLIVGKKARGLIVTLPQFVENMEEVLGRLDGFLVIGKIGRRKVLFDKSFESGMCLYNPRGCVEIVIENIG